MFIKSQRFLNAVMLLAVLPSTVLGATAQILMDPDRESSEAIYDPKNPRKSMPLLRAQTQAHPYDKMSAYLYALTLQQLGYRNEATAQFMSVLKRFPGSDVADNSIQALDRLSPQFAKNWRANHPSTARGWNVSPEMQGARHQIASQDVWNFPGKGPMLVDAEMVSGPVKALIDPKQDHSSIGRNTLIAQESPAKNYGQGLTDPVMRTTVAVGRVRRFQFPVHIVNQQHYAILGKDFLRGFNYRIDTAHGKIYLARKADATVDDIASVPSVAAGSLERYKTPGAGTTGTNGTTASQAGWSDIPINKVNNMFVANVHVNGQSVTMQVNGDAGAFEFSSQQMREIDPDVFQNASNYNYQTQYYPNNTALTTTTSSVVLKSVSLGPIIAHNLTASVSDTRNQRYSYTFNDMAYPVLGSTFWDGWDHELDVKRMVIRVRPRNRPQ